MNNETETLKQKSERALYGKVIGVIRNRYQLKALCESLATLEVGEVEVLSGSSGIQRLETWKDTVSHYFFGDMEGEMLQRYVDAVTNDFIVVAADVASELADKAAEIVKAHGATEVVHFGNSVITNY